MLLAIDIGNTNVTMGVWNGRAWQCQWRLRTVVDKTADEYGIELKTLLREFQLDGRIEAVVMASVVPHLTTTFSQLSDQYLGRPALQVNAATSTGIEIRTDHPAEVGADRIANAVAAHHLYPGGSIVIDMGTATTFDVVSGQGELLGVVIASGLVVTANALASRAAQLSQVALAAPPQVLGKNSIHAVQSGLIFGYAGLIEGIIRRLQAELAEPARQIIGTGGLIGLIAPHTEIIDHIDPWLTLTGLRLIAERAQKPGHRPQTVE